MRFLFASQALPASFSILIFSAIVGNKISHPITTYPEKVCTVDFATNVKAGTLKKIMSNWRVSEILKKV